jgi:uncharacterized membrane protein
LVVIVATAKTVPRRPWDAMLVALSPVLLLASTINWDLLGVALMMLAILAWTRERTVVAGIMLGLATSAALYPVLTLLAMLLMAIRGTDRRAVTSRFVVTVGTALLTWGAANLPAVLVAPDEWRTYFTSFAETDIEIGSTWYAIELLWHKDFGVDGNVLLISGALLVAGVIAMLLIFAPESPRLAQLAFLLLAGYFLVAKSWSPQDALWLLPLAALARPRWRDLLIWQAAEAVYFAAVWWFLAGVFTEESGIWNDLYAIAVLIRVAGLLWLAGRVARDILHPELDPVRPYLQVRTPEPAVAAPR